MCTAEFRRRIDLHITRSWTVAVPVTFRGASPDGSSVLVALHVKRPASVLSSDCMTRSRRPSWTTIPSFSHHVLSGRTGGLAIAVEHSRLTVDPSTDDQSDVGMSLTRTDTDTFGPSVAKNKSPPVLHTSASFSVFS